MKYNIILSISLMLCILTNAQVGIRTNNIQGVFNIDTEGNNATTGTPTPAQMTDDIVIDVNAVNGVNMTVGGKVATNSSAQLTLLANNKAILFNRVALTNVKDVTTIPAPLTGTLVYNTATAGDFPDNVVPAYYYFNGVVWYKWQYGDVGSALSQHDLISSVTSTEVPGLEDPSSPMLAALTNFGTIRIQQKGTYIFSFRLYGFLQANSSGGLAPEYNRGINYLYMMKNVSTLVDAIEINTATFASDRATTHTATIQALLDAGDVVTFRIGGYPGWYPWRLNPSRNDGLIANKTSLIYWKI